MGNWSGQIKTTKQQIRYFMMQELLGIGIMKENTFGGIKLSF